MKPNGPCQCFRRKASGLPSPPTSTQRVWLQLWQKIKKNLLKTHELHTHTLLGGLLFSGAWMESNCAFKILQDQLQLKPLYQPPPVFKQSA